MKTVYRNYSTNYHVLPLIKENIDMNKRLISFFFVLLLLSACTGTNQSSTSPTQANTPTPVLPSFLLPVDRVILHSASYTVTVRNPARALSELQRAVEEAGGFVSSASSWSGEGSANYASLSAKVPPEALPALSESLNKIADSVENQSVYVQDVTSEMLKLQRRHQELTQARDEIILLLVDKQNLDKLSTYGILNELLDTEIKSVESQLESYEQQSQLATFDVTINQPTSRITPIE